MQEKTLFEIPIYAMSENEFNKRWNEKREKLYADFVKHGHTDESAKQGVSSCFYPRWLWEYNQIIGYIKVSVTATDVIFDVFALWIKSIISTVSKSILLKIGIVMVHIFMP